MKMSNQLIESCTKTLAGITELLKKKNADYAGDADSYKNFIDPEMQAYFDKHKIPLDAVEVGIRVRMKDKWARLNTMLFSDKPPSLTSESFEDTLTDIIGYSAIWKAYREFRMARKIENVLPPIHKHNHYNNVINSDNINAPIVNINSWNDECICGHLRVEHTTNATGDRIKCYDNRCGCKTFQFLSLVKKEI
jgi:hypothetical protein